MTSLVCSVLILTIAVTLVNGQFWPERLLYKHGEGIRNGDEHNNEGVPPSAGEDGDTNVKLLEDNNVIPLAFLEQMDTVTDINEFIERFVAPESLDPQLGVNQKVNDSNIERAASKVPTAAGCAVDNTVVALEPLNPSKDPSVVYFPKCTRVKRCSGCCTSHTLSCQPTEVETIDFTIYKLQYDGKQKMTIRGKDHALVEQHIKCKCDCRIKKEDCNSYQEYDPSQCKCNCTNYNAMRKCLAEDDKIWDYENCKCRCRENQQCTTGTYFDDHLCKCTEILGFNSSSVLLDRRRFIVKAVPVETSNKTLYDTDGK